MTNLQAADPQADAVRADQLLRWQKGDRILLEPYLAQHAGLAQDADMLLDLIYSEVLLREEFGERPNLEEYAGRFPKLRAALGRQFTFHEAMAALADTHGGDTVDSGSPARPERRPVARPQSVGNYEILEEIGAGGMGVVYKARHRLLEQRTVAVKVLRHAASTPEEIARFHTEANAVARLHHENVVPVYEFGAYRPAEGAAEVPFVALEYVAGGNLAQKIRGTPLSPRQAAEIVLPLAQAMHHAHCQGIVHRDLKPANVLLQTSEVGGQKSEGTAPDLRSLTSDLCPKITDFGLAKKLDADQGQTPSGAILGTPSYMAPEQAAGKVVGPAADLYSLGAILYEALTGRPPFQADTLLNTLQQVATLDPVPPRRLQPNVPRDLETICLKCLHKEPDRRYGSARALADDLGRFLQGEPVRARPASRLERCAKWVRRRPALAGLIAVSVVGLSALLLGWGHFTYRLQGEKRYAETLRGKAEKERDEARRQSERAATILRHARVSIDSFAMNVRGANAEQLKTGNTGSILFQLATSYAKTSTALAKDADLPFADRAELAEQYAHSAVKLLECARLQRFFDPEKTANRRSLQTDRDLEVLHNRADFKMFLSALAK
jgi:hypothetical protein